MKKYLQIFLLITIAHSIVFSDDIVGFNFGGTFTDANKYDEFDGEKMLPHVYEVKEVKFFDGAQVGTDEAKIIKSLVFQKQYSITYGNLNNIKLEIVSDYKRMLESIEKRYGVFQKNKAQGILGSEGKMNPFYSKRIAEVAINVAPKSDSVEYIMLVLQSETDKITSSNGGKKVNLMLMYLDKDTAKAFNYVQDSDVSGF